MDTFALSGRKSRVNQRRGAGFSLIEVTLALGIVAFAFVGVFGLLPIGMNTFRQAMNTTVGGQIAQRVINDAQQTDFIQLLTDAGGAAILDTNVGGAKALRYFDQQGSEIIPVNPAAPTASEKQRILYWVNTRIIPATGTPSTGATLSNANLATVTVQVINNPGNQPLAYATAPDGTTISKLWSGAYAGNPARLILTPLTRTVFVARNQ